MKHKVLIPVCRNAQKDSAGEKQEPWFLHQIRVGPAEPGQARVAIPQLLSPQVTRFQHRGEIPEWSAPRRWSDPADQPQFNNDAASNMLLCCAVIKTGNVCCTYVQIVKATVTAAPINEGKHRRKMNSVDIRLALQAF